MNFFKRVQKFLGFGNVDAILHDFSVMTTRLRNAVNLHKLEAEAHAEAIKVREAAKAFAEAEADRAERVAANIEKFLFGAG